MGSHLLWGIIALTLCLSSITAITANLDTEGYAVGGLVTSVNGQPLQGVEVKARDRNDKEIFGNNTDSAGLFLLTIPKSYKQYVVCYHHDGYLDQARGPYENREDVFKVPPTPMPISEVKNLSVDSQNRIVQEAISISRRGRETGWLPLEEVGRNNLLMLQEKIGSDNPEGLRLQTEIAFELGARPNRMDANANAGNANANRRSNQNANVNVNTSNTNANKRPGRNVNANVNTNTNKNSVP